MTALALLPVHNYINRLGEHRGGLFNVAMIVAMNRDRYLDNGLFMVLNLDRRNLPLLG